VAAARLSLHIDEAWGTDRDTPQITVNIALELQKEIVKTANWSAQLPKGGESYLTLADIKPGGALLAHPLGSLLFQQKLVPLELRMAKASGSKISGANEFSGGALKLTQGAGAPDAKPLATRTDFFAAAQFLEMSQDDKMAKPSFESFPAGYEMEDDAYELGEIIEETLNYEEADLGAQRNTKKSRRKGGELYLDSVHGPLLQFGAAGMSPMRDRALMQPAQATALRVNPAPVVVADKAALKAVAGAQVYSSVWLAEQTRGFDKNLSLRATQVAELAEVAA